MGSRVDGCRVSPSFHDEAGGSHGAWDDAKYAFPGGGSAFAVYDHFAAFPGFLPGEVVVVFHNPQRFDAQFARNFGVDDLMARRGIVAGQVHHRPVFGALFFVQV